MCLNSSRWARHGEGCVHTVRAEALSEDGVPKIHSGLMMFMVTRSSGTIPSPEYSQQGNQSLMDEAKDLSSTMVRHRLQPHSRSSNASLCDSARTCSFRFSDREKNGPNDFL